MPLAAVPAPANHRDDGLLAATLDAITVVGPLPERPVVHLDAGYDYQPCRQVLAAWAMAGEVAASPDPGRPPVGGRARPRLGHQYGKPRWCTERRGRVIAFWLRWSTP
jgi:hypothetical protein